MQNLSEVEPLPRAVDRDVADAGNRSFPAQLDEAAAV
jgi:hypothetical protein